MGMKITINVVLAHGQSPARDTCTALRTLADLIDKARPGDATLDGDLHDDKGRKVADYVITF